MTDSAFASAASSAGHRAGTATLLALAGLTLLAGIFYLAGPLGPDVSWLITVSERMIAGQQLYVDILEPNPPMAAYLYRAPVQLAQWVGVRAEAVVVAYTLVFGLATTGIATRIAAQAGLIRNAGYFWIIAFIIAGIGWGEDFAQREHFAAMAALPIIICVAARGSGWKADAISWLVAGACGGLVMAIKPHFAIAILLAALYAGLRRRSLRPILAPEMWLAGGLLLAFLAMTWLVHPAFFTEIVPVAAVSYVPDRRPLELLLLGSRGILLYEALLVVTLLVYSGQLWRNPMLGTLFAASIGFGIAFFAQGKGYTYQIMPGVILLAIGLVVVFSERGEGLLRKVDLALASLIALALAAGAMADDVAKWRNRDALVAALAPYGPGLRIANVNSDLSATSPLHRMLDAELINSPPAMLMTLSVKRLRINADVDAAWDRQLTAVENRERAVLLADFKRRPPDIIVAPAERFDWIAWARSDAELAQLLDGFELLADVPYDGYMLHLFRRQGLVPTAP